MTHVCSTCGRGFRKAGHLRQHERDRAKGHAQTRASVRAEARRLGCSVEFRRRGLVIFSPRTKDALEKIDAALAKGSPK